MPNHPLRFAAASAAFVALCAAPAPARALTKSFCDFQDVSSLVLHGSAAKAAGNVLQLTPNSKHQAGSAWLAFPIALPAGGSFRTYFRFQISPSGGADGFTFVIQSSLLGNLAIGTEGQQLGYGGAAITPSFAVAFDTFQNTGEPSGNYVALLANADTTTRLASADPGFPLTSGQTGYVWVDFDGPSKQVDVYVASSATKPATPLLHAAADLAALGGQTYAGFTGATGGTSDAHNILEWELSTDGDPCCPTAPGGACSGATPMCSAAGVCVAASSSSSSSGSTSSSTSSGSSSSGATSSSSGAGGSATTSSSSGAGGAATSSSSGTGGSASTSSSGGTGGVPSTGSSSSGAGGAGSGGAASTGGAGTGLPPTREPVVEGGGCACRTTGTEGAALPALAALAAVLGGLVRRRPLRARARARRG